MWLMLTFIPWYPKYSHFFLYLQINGIQQLFLKLSRAMSSFVVPAKKTLTGNSLQLSTSIVLVPTQTMTILLSAIASKTCPCITGFVSVPIRWQALGAWRLDLLHSFKIQLGGAEEWPASTCTSLSPSFFCPFSLSNYLSYLTLSLFLSLSLVCFFLAVSPLSHFRSSSPLMPIFSCEIGCLSLSFPLQPPSSLPPSLSLTLCVRVCRWLLLAGSVTRGNWGRVHFNRTNGNKLIHFHCCFWDAVWVSGKRTESWEFFLKKRSKASGAGHP